MRCADVRWRLSRFLDGCLPGDETESIRDHLDSCRDCVSYLVASGKIDLMPPENSADLPAGFTERVVAEVADLDPGSTLSRLVYYIFGAASLLGVSVFAFVRYYIRPSDLNGIGARLSDGDTMATLFPWLQEWINSPSFNYVLLSFAAVTLSVGLIFAVDLAQQLFPSRNNSN